MRRKGEVTGWQIDRDYPYQIELMIPIGGLGQALGEMYSFCRETDHRTRAIGHTRRLEIGGDAMRWCFRSGDAADTFQRRFGGQRLRPASTKRGDPW